MNILIIPSWYTSVENPLNGIFFKEQAIALMNYFNKFNTNNKVFVLSLERIPVTNLKKRIKQLKSIMALEDGIPTMRASFLGIPKIKEVDFFVGSKKLKSCIKKMQAKCGVEFDLIHIHSALDAGIWYSISNLDIPFVITEHSSKYSRGLLTESEKKRLPEVFNNAKSIMAVGNGLVEQIKKYTNNPIEVIFNIVAPLFSDKDKIATTNDVFTFFSLGVNARTKGFDILFSAFSNFILQGNKGKLIIAGLEETEKEWLLSLNVVPEVLSNVILLGRIDRQSVVSYMSKCDCFALVSRYETFGIVFAEAMYCGKPVIATKTGGPDSFVNDENGILVDVENVKQTTEAMICMKKNYSRYNKNNIRQFAEKNFSPDTICEKLLRKYQNNENSNKFD